VAELSAEARNNLKGSQFVFPKERRYPISDLNHAQNALARSSGKPEGAAVKAAVYKKFPALKAHAGHDEPKDDCAFCQRDAAGQPSAEERNAQTAGALAAEHDEKHGKHEDCPNCAARKDGACDLHADDTMTPNGPNGTSTAFGGEKETELADPSSPMTAPGGDDEVDDTDDDGEAAARDADSQEDKGTGEGQGNDPWLPSGDLIPHPMTGKSVRLISHGGEKPGVLGKDGGRITHAHIGTVTNVEADGTTAYVDWGAHGKSRLSLINLQEAKQDSADSWKGIQRYDRGELGKPEYLDNGYVRVDGFIGRSGMLAYTTDTGKPWIEYRPPDEAFKADSLESFALVPLTNTHPREGLLTSENTREYQVGTVGHPRQDGEKVRAQMLVTDAGAVKDMKRGRVELSMGYTCDVDNTPGEVNGQRYDAVQRNVRGNHVALVDMGRAGSEVRARMDGSGMVQSFSDQEITLATKIKLDGVEYDISENGYQAVTKTFKAQLAEVEKAKARADGAEGQVKKLQAELKIAPEKIRAEVEARAATEADARRILGAEVKFDGKTDIEVKRAAAEKSRGVSLDGRADAYVEAAFDQAIEQLDGAGDTAGVLGVRAPATAALETATFDDGSLKFLEASMAASTPKVRAK
jgi:hypothetical protein